MLINEPSHRQNQTVKPFSLALQIFPSAHVQDRGSTLTATMQSLVLDTQYPITLEIAGTARKRSFIVRATTRVALDHVETLLRAHYPQIGIYPLQPSDDPFRIAPDEMVSAIELLPSHSLSSPAPSSSQGGDPLPGLLTTFNGLPQHSRALVQIALSRPRSTAFFRRMSAQTAQTPGSSSPKKVSTLSGDISLLVALNGAGLVGLFFLGRPLLPAWLIAVLNSLLSGKAPVLSVLQLVQFSGLLLGLLLIEGGFLWGLSLFKGLFISGRAGAGPLAYHARIFAYVISPRVATGAPPSRIARWLSMLVGQLPRQHHDMLLRISAVYQQFRLPNGAFFFHKRLSSQRARRLLSQGRGWERRLRYSRNLIESDILATLWHLPLTSALPEMPFVEQNYSRTLMMPPAVARQSQGLPPAGYSEQNGRRVPFALPPQFFAHHTLISGRTGEGKSALIQHIAQMAMMQGGLLLIDPYGNLCDQVLQQVPAARAEDVVLVDLADSTASVGLNPLDVTSGRERDKAISDLLKMLAHIWVSSWGARMENAFEMSLRTLFEANKVLVEQDKIHGPEQQYTLLDVLPLLTNAQFCHALLQQIQDDYLHRWWREYYEPLSLIQQRDVINPVITRVAKFESMTARRIVGQSVSTLDFVQLISERKIILVRLAKGLVGSDVVALVGATILGLLQITLEEQGLKGLPRNRHLPIILDEFQMLTGTDYRTLVELQKYGATFFLATQSLEYLQKLNALLLPTVMANVKQVFAFSMSAQDAEIVHKELEVERKDIMHLDQQSCYASLMVSNQRQPTFSLKVEPPLSNDPALPESIRTRCRIHYTRPIDSIDERLRAALIRSIRLSPSTPIEEDEIPSPVPPQPHVPEPAPQPEAADVARDSRSALPQLAPPP